MRARETPNHITVMLVSKNVWNVLEEHIGWLQLFHQPEDMLDEVGSAVAIQAFLVAHSAQAHAREPRSNHIHVLCPPFLILGNVAICHLGRVR